MVEPAYNQGLQVWTGVEKSCPKKFDPAQAAKTPTAVHSQAATGADHGTMVASRGIAGIETVNSHRDSLKAR
jgi:hypothetical protein